MVEIEVALRDAGKAGEGIDGAGGQGAGAAAQGSATGVSGADGIRTGRNWPNDCKQVLVKGVPSASGAADEGHPANAGVSSLRSGEIKERILSMRTVKSLIEELARFPDEALCHAYEGEIIGIVVRLGGREGVIHCGEGEGPEPETQPLKAF
ncbi:hypothetical protein KBZ08_09880 [Cyanobium sp. Candia 9D4]|nr:hypothetical protein [Cyanobium sp. Candia 9D4]